MADENEIEVKIGVNDSEVGPGMQGAAEQVRSAVGSMQETFANLTGQVSTLTKVLAGVAVVLGAAGLFKSAIDKTIELSDEVTNMSKKLGISREEASGLIGAIGDVGVSTSTYISVVTKLNRELRQNEEGMNRMGVVTRTATGELRGQNEIMQSALAAVSSYREGIDRNLASMALFGRSSGETTKLLELTSEVIEGASSDAKNFGLIMGQEVVEQARKMRFAMGDIADAGTGIMVAIGREALPHVVAFAEFMSANATPIMEGFAAIVGLVINTVQLFSGVVSDLFGVVKSVFTGIGDILSVFFGDVAKGSQLFVNVIAVMRTAIISFGLLITEVMLVIRQGIDLTMRTFVMMANVAKAAFNMDWDGVKSAWDNGLKGIRSSVVSNSAAMVKAAQEAGTKIHHALMGTTPETAAPPPDPFKGGDKEYVEVMRPKIERAGAGSGRKHDRNMLASQLALDKAIFEAELEQLKDNLDRSEALYDEAYSRNLITTKEYYAAKLSIETSGLDKEIETKRKEIEAINLQLQKAQAKGTPEGEKEVLRFRAELVKTTSQLTILENHRAEAAINNTTKMVEAERVRADQISEIAIRSKQDEALALLDIDRQTFGAMHEAGIISSLQLIDLERDLQNRKTEIFRQAIEERKALEIGGVNDPVAVAALNEQLLQIARQHALEMTALNIKTASEIHRPYDNIQKSLKSSLDGTIRSLLAGTMTLSTALKNILGGLADSIIMELVTKPLTAKIAAWATEKIFNMGQISSSAGVAGAEAVKAMAGIPIVGPAMAAVAGPATYALAMGFGAMSARDGYDIPAGTNPMTQLHQKEMVLPEKHAETIRNLDGGGGQAITYNDHTGTLSRQQIRENVKHIADALKDFARKQ